VLPTEFVRLLAQQISEQLPEFGPAVLEFVAPAVKGEARADINWGEVIGIQIKYLTINSPDPKEVYHRSVRQPLERLCERNPDARVFILVDALDEALTSGATCTIVDLLAGSEDFPPNVRFLLTSRPEPRVLEKFRRARPLKLSDPTFTTQVDGDIRAYIEQRGISGFRLVDIEALVTAAAGNFLYVHWLLDEVARGVRNADDFTTLPTGLHALYHDSLNRLVQGADPNTWPKRFQPLLGRLSVAAAEVPLEVLGEWTNQQAEVAANLSRIYQFIEPSGGGASYRLYHRSMADFLALAAYDSNGVSYPNLYHTPPLLQHQAIAEFYLGRFQRWQDCDNYGLRHFVGHLYACINLAASLEVRSEAVTAIYRTLLDAGFAGAYQQKLGELAVVLGDLRTGLRVALREDDLAKEVTFLGRYRRAQRALSIVPEVFTSVQKQNFSVALKRAELYRSIPDWGRCLFLYLAWEAARQGDTSATYAAIKAAWNSPIARKSYSQNGLSDALFAHVAQLLSQQPNNPHDAGGWMLKLDPFRPSWIIDRCLQVIRPTRVLSEFEKHSKLIDLERICKGFELQCGGTIRALGPDFATAEMVSLDASRLEEILRELARDPIGQEKIDGFLDAVVTNPYPAYRDIALTALGNACLSASTMPWVAQRLRRILQAALDTEGVTFTFDLPTILTFEAARRRLPAEDLKRYCEQAYNTAADAWGTRLRALSAEAAALFRQANRAAAFRRLDLAAEERQGFAGFFSLHYLALANRWWEFGKADRARNLISLAAESASHVRDYEFRVQREQLVRDYETWCTHETPTFGEALDCLNAISTHDTRMAYLDHVSARWAGSNPPNLEALKAALPFVASDATALDSMLARLIGLRLAEFSNDDFVEAVQACSQFLTSGRPWEFSRGANAVP
jgi:hypothetical protein